MNKTVDADGNIKINDMTFLEFSRLLFGYDVVRKNTNFRIPRFVLFWKGFTIAEIKSRYTLVARVK